MSISSILARRKVLRSYKHIRCRSDWVALQQQRKHDLQRSRNWWCEGRGGEGMSSDLISLGRGRGRMDWDGMGRMDEIPVIILLVASPRITSGDGESDYCGTTIM